jgi:hypothetical protein
MCCSQCLQLATRAKKHACGSRSVPPTVLRRSVTLWALFPRSMRALQQHTATLYGYTHSNPPQYSGQDGCLLRAKLRETTRAAGTKTVRHSPCRFASSQQPPEQGASCENISPHGTRTATASVLSAHMPSVFMSMSRNSPHTGGAERSLCWC